MSYDRDHVYVKGKAILHSTAARDWVCGECGSRLVTRFFPDAPNWRTVCANDDQHNPDEFVHSSRWAYVEAQQRMDAMIADDVLAHLPPDLQATIERKERETCQSSA